MGKNICTCYKTENNKYMKAYDGNHYCYSPILDKMKDSQIKIGGCNRYAENICQANTCYIHKFNKNFKNYCQLIGGINNQENEYIEEVIDKYEIITESEEILGVKKFSELTGDR